MKATPLKAPPIWHLQLYYIGIVILGNLPWKHYTPKTKISPEGPFGPSPEQNYASHHNNTLKNVCIET